MLAAIDTGSNAIRMAISEFEPNKSMVFKEVLRVPVRLGKDVFSAGFVRPQTSTEVLRAFKRFRRLMDKHHVLHYKAVATSALREARNGSDLVERIRRASNIDLEIIDGLEEARLVQLAIAKYYRTRQLDATIIDIGGGSTEVILVSKGALVGRESLRLGTVRMLKDFNPDRQFEQMHNQVKRDVGRFHSRIRRHWLNGQQNIPAHLVVTGGNARSLGRLAKQFMQTPSSQKMTMTQLESLMTLLHSMSNRARREELGLRPDRADVILPASMFIHEFATVFNYQNILLPKVGIKNGVLVDLLETHKKK
ncbi:MAG: hypothetical protein IT288_14305 [Bdellovibrionales bacterium]|nr:hypothetical protein [Bdellovibrionales bacterium]